MKIGIMQPYFFPYIGYWQLINAVDEYVIYDDVNYIKQGWIHRNYILLNGSPTRINLHIKNASQNRLILDTKLAQTKEDNDALLKTIKQSYSKSPQFKIVYKLIENILECQSINLAEYLTNQIEIVCNYLNIETKIVRSSAIKKDEMLKGEEKIIAICKAIGADEYINAVGGKVLYNRENFRNENISLKFLETQGVSYDQNRKAFVSGLSIIDVMMFNDVDTIRNMLELYKLD